MADISLLNDHSYNISDSDGLNNLNLPIDDEDNYSTDDENDIGELDQITAEDAKLLTNETDSEYLGLVFENEDKFKEWVNEEFNGYAVIHAKKKWRVGEHIGKHRDWTISCKFSKRCNCPFKMYIAWTLNSNGPCIRRVYSSQHSGHQIEVGSHGEMIRLEDVESKRIALQTMSLQVLQSNFTLQSLLRNSKKILFNNYRYSTDAKKAVTDIFNTMKSAYVLSHPTAANKSSFDNSSNNISTSEKSLIANDPLTVDNSKDYLNLEFENEEKFRVWVCDEFHGLCVVQPKKKFEKGENEGKFRDWVVVCRHKSRGCNFKMYVSWNKHNSGPRVKSSNTVHNGHSDEMQSSIPSENDQTIRGEDILELRNEVEDLAKHSVEAGLSCAVLVKQCRKTLFKNFHITKGAEQTIRYLYRNVKNGSFNKHPPSVSDPSNESSLSLAHPTINASSKLAKVLHNQHLNNQSPNEFQQIQFNNVVAPSNGLSEYVKKRKYEEYINIFDKAISTALNTLPLEVISNQFNNFLTNLLNEQIYLPTINNNIDLLQVHDNSFVEDHSMLSEEPPNKQPRL